MAHMPCALLVGHSFVRRTTEFIERNQEDGSYTHTFGLESTCTVKTIGTGGRTVDKLIKYDLQDIRDTAPNVVILDIGSNDLCDEQSDPDTVALSIIALVEILIKDLKLRCLVLCQVLPRKKKTTIYGIQRKGLAIKWFTKGSCQRHSWGKVLDSPWLM